MNLHLLQLGDSASPIGGYSHSWGLEAAVARGLVRDPAGLEEWVRSWLWYAVGPLEGVVVRNVCRAAAQGDWAVVSQAQELLRVSMAPPTLRLASRTMGEQLFQLATRWPWAAAIVQEAGRSDADGPERHHAAVFGILAAGTGASPAEAVTVYLHQAALGAIGAGVRAIPVGHTHGQEILARLHPELPTLVRELADRDLETAGSLCPAYEVWCYEQSQLYTRLFRS